MSPTASPEPKAPGVASHDTHSRAHFEQAATLYAKLGFSDERAALTLTRTGFPLEWIRSRYASVPLALLEATRAPQDANRKTARGRGGLKRVVDAMAAEGTQALLPLNVRAPASATRPASTTSPNTPRDIAATAPISAPTTAAVRTATPAPDLSPAPLAPDAISFQYVPLIQCSFPHMDPGDVHTFTRRNGWLELTLATARRDFGLPYGVPARLLTIYFASEAVRTRSPEIYLGESVNDFLRLLDVPVTRGPRGSQRVYANQLLRLLHCAVSIDENVHDGAGRQGLHIRQALFAEEARLWWDNDGVGQGSSFVLSSVLFDSILERSAPLSTAAIKQLRKSPMDLDVYAWLVHRLHNLGNVTTVTWPQLSGQFGHGYSEPRTFRRFFLDSLKRVLAVYSEARVKPTATGLMLMPSRPHIAKLALQPRR